MLSKGLKDKCTDAPDLAASLLQRGRNHWLCACLPRPPFTGILLKPANWCPRQHSADSEVVRLAMVIDSQ